MENKIKEIREQWFPEHVARRDRFESVEDRFTEGLTIIDWRKPGTGMYSVRYIFDGSTLFVRGDIGAAAYSWSDRINPEFVAECNIRYFASKCENGCGLTWDEKLAKDRINERLDEIFKDKNPAYGFASPRQKFVEMQKIRGPVNPYQFISCRADWHDFLGMRGIKNFEGSDDSDIGMTYDMRTIGHLVGLQMAVEQLKVIK